MTPCARPSAPCLLLVAAALNVALARGEAAAAEPPVPAAAGGDRPRLLVLTDIGGDPDDQQSMVRLMLYANAFDIEGLVASAAGTPGELKDRVTKPHLIRQIVEAYGRVRPNLARYADGYPPAEQLLAAIAPGNPNRGKGAVGEGKDTEGSRRIIAAVDRPDPRPLNISIWGGQTDLAQALWRVRADRGANGLARFVARLRVYDITDQDKIADWMWDEFPGMFYVLAAAAPGRDKRDATFRGMYLGGDESLTSRQWVETNVRLNHGPLGALYPGKTWTAPNPHATMKEGDTPSWFHFLPTGLSDPDRPEWGGWSGRFELDPKLGGGRSRIYRDAKDTVGDVTDARAAVWRWRPAFQADFQARLDWCMADDGTAKAERRPAAVLNSDATGRVLAVDAVAGGEVVLTHAGEPAPDGQRAQWFFYPEAGTYRGDPPAVRVESDGRTVRFRFTAPAVKEPKTLHVILEVRGDGQPVVASYRRAVVTVRPN